MTREAPTNDVDETRLEVGKPKGWAAGIPGVAVSVARGVEQMGVGRTVKALRLLNQRDGVLALSRDAGAWAELGGTALEVNPFDVAGTADAIAAALSMDPDDRAAHATALRKLILMRTPRDWLDDQLAAAQRGA